MTAVSGLGALATLISTAFALSTYERWRASGGRHQLAWTQSLTMFALGSLAYWSAGAVGWTAWNFRAFYLFGAILNVPYLALGTVYLLGGATLGSRLHRWVNLLAAASTGIMIAAPLVNPLPASGLPEGRATFGILPRVLAAVGSGVAATVLIVGAIWSAASLLIRRRRPARGSTGFVPPARLAVTNVLIAAGSIVLSLGGVLFTGNDRETGFGVLLVVGIVMLFGGFLVSGGAPPQTDEPPAGLSDFGRELWELTHQPG